MEDNVYTDYGDDNEDATNCEVFVIGNIDNGTYIQGFVFARYDCRYEVQSTDVLRSAQLYSTQSHAESALNMRCVSADWRICRVSLRIIGVL